MKALLFVLFPALTSCQLWNQTQLDNFAQTLKVKWKVKDNTEFDRKFLVEVTLTNGASGTLSKEGNWSIFLNSMRLIEPDVLPRPEGVVLEGQGVKVTHIQGSLFCLQPTGDFLPLPSNSSRKVKFSAKDWEVVRTSILPNWYLHVPGLTPMTIKSTVGEELSFVESFTKPQQVKRYSYDKYSPFTAQERYRRNHLEDPFDDGEIRVIPKPLSMTVDNSSSVLVNETWTVVAATNLSNEETFLKRITNPIRDVVTKIINNDHGCVAWQLFGEFAKQIYRHQKGDTDCPILFKCSVNLPRMCSIPMTKITNSQSDVENDVIRMRIGNVEVNSGGIPGNSDNYHLSVNTTNRVIEIIGQGSSGVFYGAQTLLSLMSQRGGQIYKTDITDSPRYPYRGLQFDVSRNFRSKEDIKQILNTMAMYKLNKFHFHLSDDEGWRLEIPGLEELTTVGSKRCHDVNETTCLFPQLGSGPTQSTSGSGFYNQTEYREILQQANRLHIQVIPEFDMPGHARAAIKSMEARFKRLQAAGKDQEGRKYLLAEEGDMSGYITPQMYTDNAVNPCMESTYTFIDHVISELVKMHEGIQPLTVYHYGGDEVGRGAWVNSTQCKTMFNSDTVSTAQVKQHFFTRMSNITQQYSLNMAAREDGLVREGNVVFDRSLAKNDEVMAYSWNDVWESGSAGRSYDMANKGYKVVMAPATHLYFNNPYEPGPEERGNFGATRFIDSEKTFSLTPENLYSLIDVKGSGETITRAEVCGANDVNCPPLQNSTNIIGIQGCLFTEEVRTRDQADFLLFPHILPLAERAWHKASWESEIQTEAGMSERKADWESFARHIGRLELPRLDGLTVKYRMPPPGAVVENGFLKYTSTFPGLLVQYSKDGGNTWYRANNNVVVRPSQEIHLRTRSSDGKRFSRVVSLYGTEPLPLVDQSVIDYMAENVNLKYKVVDNLQDGDKTFLAQVTLTNTGQQDVVAGNWGIYYCSIYMVPKDQTAVGLVDITITHVKGCLFKMEPTTKFKPLKPNDVRKLKFRVDFWSVSRTDTMPNWYFWAEGMKGKTIASTRGSELGFVADFTTPNQWKRYNTTEIQDRYNPYTPEQRYDMSEDIPDLGSAQLAIIPTPVTMVTDSDMEPLDISTVKVIVTAHQFNDEAQYLQDELSKGGYSSKTILSSAPSEAYYIQLMYRDPQVYINGKMSTSPEAYSLTVDPATAVIKIWSKTPHGIFNGIQSLLSLVLKHHPDGKIPKLTIEDAPRFEHRGMHLDVCRNFHSKEDVMKELDVMAMYKLNKFHIHLTEDEGWRVEVPGLDELTKIGGQRCHDLSEEKCIMSQLGSGPDTTTSGSGFYTVEDYKEILRYAKTRHIEVIPEVESPGHGHAAITAMKARRQRLLDIGDTANADKYSLVDNQDKPDFLSAQMFDDNAINPCINSTYTFFTYIVNHFIEMHKDISPLKRFHFGGDEVAAGAWLHSPACQSLLKANVSLKEYFTQRMASITAKRGLTLGGWEDGLMESASEPFRRDLLANTDVVVNAWSNVWEWGNAKRAYILANAGYKVILSHATHLFFDHPYEPDPEERGFYWATRLIQTYKTYGYMPDSVYDNVGFKRSGEPMTKEDLCGEDGAGCPPLTKPENIIGIQGQLWSETIRSRQDQFYKLLPKLLAFAERAWHKAPWEDKLDMKAKREEWRKFANTVGYQELPAFDKMNISYRVPLPGAKVIDGRLRVVAPYPGLGIDVSSDNGNTWREGQKDMSPVVGRTLVSLKSADGKRRSRAVEVILSDTSTVKPAIKPAVKSPGSSKPTSSASLTKTSINSIALAYVLHMVFLRS